MSSTAGECPDTTGMVGACAEFCSSDADCRGGQRCCSNGCGHACMDLYTSTVGECPDTTGMVGACAEFCSSDADCSGGQRCCSNGCGHACMDVNRG
uniref:WAP domain-containing protein n=1 Tax=Branchiostoma floridae TaxID=7739 RepID=C3XYV3_BRAFL|eukprot:XP_002610978.1 hypothetical protein BRAFLDRAFT_231486 [Branchiostoma floridae]